MDDAHTCKSVKRPAEEEEKEAQDDGEDHANQRSLLAFEVSAAGRDFSNSAVPSSSSAEREEDVEPHHHHVHEVDLINTTNIRHLVR